ncbi:virulence RhuM family protein [Wolbachia endosymbiont of Folsomia candida]|uniref:virulence RhuM family protein n=1 Tax=Wolbachia endosymbiont of Folsomia candida TaxID=169402 RepID=UPI000AE7A4E5|nr:virulence RhuM family protein [Wolbachia endosymbiont of Folsomia candida]APR97867.1 cell filamentation protein Fic [Wolbachia endosymbiont of Folsomia candida]
MNNKLPDYNEILFYETDDGKVCIEVRFENDNLWLTQKHMAELFGCSGDNISLHLKNIYLSKELDKSSTTEESSTVQKEGQREVKRNVVFYNLEAVISVGYRVNSERGTAFRTWATDKLKKYIFKGFAIDSNRFKNGTKFDARFFDELVEEIREIRASERMAYQKITDVYATSVDYSSCTIETRNFFAMVQNKLHFAITGNTAAEIIANRANRNKPNMGLTSWRKAPKEKIFLSDTQVAKNYLDKNEIAQLNKIVNMYIDYAEFQAARGKVMYMKDWKEKLDAFLKFNEQEILDNRGKVSHELAIALATKEYEAFRKIQDKSYKSDFDRLVEESKKKNLSQTNSD